MDRRSGVMFDKVLLSAIKAANTEYVRQLESGEELCREKVEAAAMKQMIYGLDLVERRN